MNAIRWYAFGFTLFWVGALFAVVAYASEDAVVAAQVEPLATATPEVCQHVATADSIKIYFCEDINLFVDQLGFMAFEP